MFGVFFGGVPRPPKIITQLTVVVTLRKRLCNNSPINMLVLISGRVVKKKKMTKYEKKDFCA